MRVTDFILTESISPIVYHYTNLPNAVNILSNGEFELSSVYGSIEQQFAPKGFYPYFLSTTRSRQGGYHRNKDAGVIFVLDGTWYNSKYKGAPVDYWNDRDTSKQFDKNKAHEAEDRIFSKTPTISIGGVKEIHVLVTPGYANKNNGYARKVILFAKKLNIPVHLYNDTTSWVNFDKRNVVSPTTLTGTTPKSYGRSLRDYLQPWLELAQSSKKEHLSKKANDLRYSLMYTHDRTVAGRGLAADLSNARKPDGSAGRESAVKLIQFMRNNNLQTIDSLIEFLSNKWKNIS